MRRLILNMNKGRKRRDMNETKTKPIRYGLCFLLIAALCWLFPYSGDDWAWGSEIGMERLNVWFDNYNGRYVGNLIEMAMTRSNLVKTFIMGFCLTGIIYLAERIIRQKWAFYISCLALLLIPRPILRQAIVWSAGYSNYVVSIFLTFIFIAYVYPIFEKNTPKDKLWHSIPLLGLGFISALIVEHITIYNVVLAVGTILYTIAAHRKVLLSHVSYLLGSIGGTAYMFSNQAYHSIANNQDGYRQVAQGGIISRSIENYVQVIAKHLCLNNVWLNLAILTACILLFWQCIPLWKTKAERITAKSCLAVLTFFNIWAFLSSSGIGDNVKREPLLYAEAVLGILYLLACVIFSALVGIRKKCLWKVLFWNASILCITGPLLFVNPIGERCFFATYILFIMLLLELLHQLDTEQITGILEGRLFRFLCILGCTAGLAFYLNVYSSISQADHDRLEYIQEQVAGGETATEIIHLPYESYIWGATPEYEPWYQRYKLFHGLPKDLEIKTVSEYSDKNDEINSTD